MTILGVLSAVLMQRVVISPATTSFEPINIYTWIALPPANHKSFVLNACLQPLLDWEEEQKQQLSTEIKRKCNTKRNTFCIYEAYSSLSSRYGIDCAWYIRH